MKRFAIISGDSRQIYINEYFSQLGLNSELKVNFDLKDYDYVICSTPFTKDNKNVNCDFYSSFPISTFVSLIKPDQIVFGGNIPDLSLYNIDKLGEIAINSVDILKDDYVVWNNAMLTAEGLISKIIINTPFTISDSNILIMGFGKCGINAAIRLKALGGNVSIYDHTPAHLCQAKSMGLEIIEYKNLIHKLQKFNIIINTVPKEILLPMHYKLIKKNCVLFEIASAPFGFNNTLIKENQLSLITCPALPGATAPKAAGELIAKSIISYLERNGINDL